MYDITSSWHGNAVGSPALWTNALVTHGVPQAQAARIAAAYFTYFVRAGLNPDLGLAQAAQETGWFSSAHWLNQYDPAGLGVTDDTAVGATYATIEGGVSGHAAHVCCYVYDAATCPIENNPDIANDADHYNDPRHIFHDGIEAISTLERPNRKWAVPGDNYVQAILMIANAVTGFPPPIRPPAPSNGTVRRLSDLGIDYGHQTSVNIFGANGYSWPGRAASPIRAVVCHVAEGTYLGSLSWANDPAADASFNFIVAKDGRIGSAVDPASDRAPWANGVQNPGRTNLPPGLADLGDGVPNLNWVTVSVEHEGHYLDADFPTTAQLDASAELIAALMLEYGLAPSGDTIIRHAQVDPSGRPNCPGPHFDIDSHVAHVAAILGGEAPSDGPSVTIDGYTIAGGFLTNLWSSTKHPYQIFGNPKSGEFDGLIWEVGKASDKKARTLQLFERGVMVHDGNEPNPEWQDTLLLDTWAWSRATATP